MSTCIFTIIKNEHDYLDEFIKYSIGIGIDRIIIAEDDGSLSHKKITDRYPSDKVSLIKIDDCFENERDLRSMLKDRSRLSKMQNRYVQRGLGYVKEHYNYDWCFIIDIDEYLTFGEKYENINDVMKDFDGYDAVMIYYENYGANGLVRKPSYKDKGILETYTSKCEFPKRDGKRFNTKCAYNMNTYTNNSYRFVHCPNPKINYCKTDFSKDEKIPTYERLYIRHYITKSFEEYVWKLKIRGMFFNGHRRLEDFFDMNTDMADRKDELMEWADEYIQLSMKENG